MPWFFFSLFYECSLHSVKQRVSFIHFYFKLKQVQKNRKFLRSKQRGRKKKSHVIPKDRPLECKFLFSVTNFPLLSPLTPDLYIFFLAKSLVLSVGKLLVRRGLSMKKAAILLFTHPSETSPGLSTPGIATIRAHLAATITLKESAHSPMSYINLSAGEKFI